MSITEKRLKELRERLDAAMKDWSNQDPASNQVWNFFAHAPTDIADLIAEVHRLRAELAKVREVTEETVERSARAAYGPKAWDKLDLRDPMTAVQRSAFMAQIRTALVSAAGGDDA